MKYLYRLCSIPLLKHRLHLYKFTIVGDKHRCERLIHIFVCVVQLHGHSKILRPA